MRQLKKIACILAGTIMLGGIGCHKELPLEEAVFTGSGAATIAEMVPEEGAKLTLWVADKDYGQAIATAFEREYGVPVTVEQEGLSGINKIALSGPAGEGADVYISAHDNFSKGLASGVFMPLEAAIKKDITERVDEVAVATVTKDNVLYGIPFSMEVNALFYNKGIINQPAATLEEIIEEAPMYNDVANNKFYFLCCIGDGYYEYPFLSAEGYKLFGEKGDDNDNPGFDTDAFENGLSLIRRLNEIMPIKAVDLANKSSLKNNFMEGNVAYLVTGSWDVTQFKESDVDFGIAMLPTYKGNALKPFAGVQCAHVSPYTDYPIAAQLLAAFMVSDEGANILYEEYDGITTLKDVSQIPGLANDENVKVFKEEFSQAVPMPSVSRISFFWSIIQDITKAVFDGDLTPKEGREKAIGNWNALLATE